MMIPASDTAMANPMEGEAPVETLVRAPPTPGAYDRRMTAFTSGYPRTPAGRSTRSGPRHFTTG